MNCKECQEQFVDPQEISASERNPEVSAHLSTCESCRNRLADAKILTAGFSSLAERPAPIELSERILKIPGKFVPRRKILPFWQSLKFQMGFSFAVAASILVFLILNPPSEDQVPLKEATRFKKVVTSVAPGGEIPSAFPQKDLLEPIEKEYSVSAKPVTEKKNQAVPSPAPFQVAAGPKEVSPVEEKPAPSRSFTPMESGEKAKGKIESARTSETPSVAQNELVSRGEDSKRQHLDKADKPFQMALAGASAEKKAEESRPDALDNEADRNVKPEVVVGEPIVSPVKEAIERKDADRIQLAKAPAADVSSHEETQTVTPQTTPEKNQGGRVMMYAPSSDDEKGYSEADKSSLDRPGDEKDVKSGFEMAGGSGNSAPTAAPSADSGFAPPPPVATKMMASKVERRESPKGAIDSRIEKLHQVIRQHENEISSGRLDINLWVIKKWISVKDRISISPDSGMEWYAKKDKGNWRIYMTPVNP